MKEAGRQYSVRRTDTLDAVEIVEVDARGFVRERIAQVDTPDADVARVFMAFRIAEFLNGRPQLTDSKRDMADAMAHQMAAEWMQKWGARS